MMPLFTRKTLIPLAAALFFLMGNSLLMGQQIQTEFGKNRVQYHDDFDEWLMYESQNFITYWYGKGRMVGQSVAQMAELDFLEIQDLLEHRINDKIQIIVYVDLTDLKQSNIGNEEAFVNEEGQTKIAGNKIFVHFNGNHRHLRRQIREGVATVYINSMLFGSNIQEIVQNAVLMNLPEWFKQGLAAYVGQSWNTDLDNELRDILLNNRDYSFEDLMQDNAKLAGHSLWFYIGKNFGNTTISNLLYLTRINRSVESGFLYVLGTDFESTLDAWEGFFRERYRKDVENTTNISLRRSEDIKNRRELPFTRIRLSPDGTQLAYVLNEIGKYKIYVRDLQKERDKVVFKFGFRNPIQATDYNYPLIAWNPAGTQLAILYEKHDVPKLLIKDFSTGEEFLEDLAPGYTRVLNMDYLADGQLLFTAMRGGYSDIFIYYTATRQSTAITNDFWDDLDATYTTLGGKKGILFVSNRRDSVMEKEKLDTILPILDFDIFYYALEDNERNEVVRVTQTPTANERLPMQADSTYLTYLSDISGRYNRYSAYLKEMLAYYESVLIFNDGTEMILVNDTIPGSIDSTMIDTVFERPVYKLFAFSHPNTNYPVNIEDQHIPSRSTKLAEVIRENGEEYVFVRHFEPAEETQPAWTAFQKNRAAFIESFKTIIEEDSDITDTINMAKNLPEQEPAWPKRTEEEVKYLFQTEFDDPPSYETEEPLIVEHDEAELQFIKPQFEQLVEETPQGVHQFRPARIVPYRLKFRTDYFTTKLDNNLLFGGLDTYAGNMQEYNYPPPGILFKFNFKDLFEDYQFEGGVRLPTTFNGAEYFLVFDDFKNRIDKRYALYRSTFRDSESGNNNLFQERTRSVSVIALSQLRYPIDIFRSVRLTGTVRLDKFIQLATDAPTLDRPTINEQRLGLRAEYVFDNTLDISLNIKNGTRYKVFAEVVKKMQVDLYDSFQLNFAEGFMTILGFDARHYQRLLKHSVFASRLTAATSFGSEKILYFIGGTENWLFPRMNEETPFPFTDDFAYQTLASNMRGFRQNIRNGNSVALFNAELRIPFFKYLFPTSRSSFLQNFQAVGFFDAGTAWVGSDPFSKDTPLNTVFLSNPTVDVKVNYFRDPLVAGYGVGIRSVLFGYFVRLDYAWGIETREVTDPIFYFSLGYDF